MNSHDAIDAIFTLDDRQRELTAEIETALRELEGRLASLEGIRPGQIDLGALRRQVEFGCVDPQELRVAMDVLRDGVISTALRELNWPSSAEPSSEDPTLRIAHASRRIAAAVDEMRTPCELTGRIRHLLARRAHFESELRGAHERMAADELLAETLSMIVAARQGGCGWSAVSARLFLDEIDTQAAADPSLSCLAASIRKAREALGSGGHSAPGKGSSPGSALASWMGDIATLAAHLARARQEARQHLDRLGLEAEREDEALRSRAHLAERASAVRALACDLERRLERGLLPGGALGPLKAACLEHGALTLLLGFRDVSASTEQLAPLASGLAARLGTLIEDAETTQAERHALERVFDELAVADAGTLENDWEQTFSMVMGMWRDAGIPAVKARRLEELLAADGYEAWGKRLLARIAAKEASVARTRERLAGACDTVREIAASGRASASVAAELAPLLAEFMTVRERVELAYHAAVRARLEDEEHGLALLAARTAAFRHCEALGVDATGSERREAHARTLEEVARHFEPLSLHSPGKAVASPRNSDIGASADACRRELAALTARVRRLRHLLLPPLDETCRSAMALAADLQADSAKALAALAGEGDPASVLGDHLEALDVELGFLDMLEGIPSGAGDAVLPDLLSRDRRFLELQGASLTLLAALGRLAAAETHEGASQDADWLDELSARAKSDLERYMSRLERCLLDLPGSEERSLAHDIAVRACGAWKDIVGCVSDGAPLRQRLADACNGMDDELARIGIGTLERLEAAGPSIGTVVGLDNLVDFLDRAIATLEGTPAHAALGRTLASRRARAVQVREDSSEAPADSTAPDLAAAALFA